jgi:hypothetical protein
MITKGPWELTVWLVRITGKALEHKVLPKSVTEPIEKLITNNIIKVIDYDKITLVNDGNRREYPDPCIIWKQLSDAYNACVPHEFAYLFFCIEKIPSEKLISANENLICNFVMGTLGYHLSQLKLFTYHWLKNLPDLGLLMLSRNHQFTGTTAMEQLYDNLILKFFAQKKVNQHTYFEQVLLKLDVRMQPLHCPLEQLETQYQMHLFLVGNLGRTEFASTSAQLEESFRKYGDCVEYDMTVAWPSRFTPYEDRIVEGLGHDAFIWLMRLLRDLLDHATGKLTAYELYGPKRPTRRDARDNMQDGRVQHGGSTPTMPRNQQYRRSASTTEVRTAETVQNTQVSIPDPAHNANPPTQVRPACPCGRPNHLREDCRRRNDWPITQEEYDRVINYVNNPSSVGFNERVANALRPANGNYRGRG